MLFIHIKITIMLNMTAIYSTIKPDLIHRQMNLNNANFMIIFYLKQQIFLLVNNRPYP